MEKTSTKSLPAFIDVLAKYYQSKQLTWELSPGYLTHSVRAIPPSFPQHSVQIIIPYKDQKELTLKCVHSLLKQTHVNFKITAVDNRSSDLTIAQEIRNLGGEVISIDEPFNYSRLNNLAVKMTQTAQACDLLLFLNNDVELQPDALEEMVRWIDQPHVGMVGCRLHFPDGRLQHGGVFLGAEIDGNMSWEHLEKLRSFDEMNRTKVLGVFDAVTAACALVKRSTFLDVGGFNEIWYPIGYSDTHLAVKLSSWGLKCFYTPYASGTHYESLSRKGSIEDYENSRWLHDLLAQHQKLHL